MLGEPRPPLPANHPNMSIGGKEMRQLIQPSCMAVEDAQRSMLSVGKDSRPVMRSALAMFQGKLSPAVFAKKTENSKDPKDIFYRDLYLGLWYEAAGDAVAARRHILAASQGVDNLWHLANMHKDDGVDYMWFLSSVHAYNRGWAPLPSIQGRPEKTDL